MIKPALLKLLILLICFIATYCYLPIYLSYAMQFDKSSPNLEEVLKYSNVKITEEHFFCEANIKHDVGSVLLVMITNYISDTIGNIKDDFSYGCYFSAGDECSTQCGTIMLRFTRDKNNKPISNSFMCVDIP